MKIHKRQQNTLNRNNLSHKLCAASSGEADDYMYLSPVMRKPVIGVSDQVRHKLGRTVTDNFESVPLFSHMLKAGFLMTRFRSLHGVMVKLLAGDCWFDPGLL